MNLEDVHLRSTRALQPAANTVGEGAIYYVTDEGVLERSNGVAWQSYSAPSATTTANYIVSTTEAGLPSSHVLSGGAGIVITSTTGFTTIRNSATTSSYIVATTSTTTLPNSLVITAGSNITVTQTAGTIVIASTAGASTTSSYIVATTSTTVLPNSLVLTAGTNITITNTLGTLVISSSGGSGASTTAPFLVSTTTTTLPNSVILVAGSNVTFTTSTTSITINAAAGGGGSSWTFITTAPATGATVDFTTGLSTFSEIMIIMKEVTVTGAAIRRVLVTTNGTTFLSASGDYWAVDGQGATTAATNISFDNGNNALSHSGWVTISMFNNSNSIKPVTTPTNGTNLVGFVNTTTALVGIRALPNVNTFNGGNFYVYGR